MRITYMRMRRYVLTVKSVIILCETILLFEGQRSDVNG